MGKVYRTILSRLPGTPNAAFLDTPAGFELNSDTIYDKAAGYFSKRLGVDLERASFKNKARASAVETAAALDVLRRADFIFSGPGSPSYTIRHWKQTPVWDALSDRLAHDAHLVFASAAAIAVSAFALPVYEIYKAGHDPYWLDGMNLFAALGLNLVIVPHWNNTEGGTYDTRFCYMGETRFLAMEQELPAGAVVLGIDEYTACIFDLPAQTCHVMGAGNVTLRCDGQEWVYLPGQDISFEQLRSSRLLREPAAVHAPPGEPERESVPVHAQDLEPEREPNETSRYLFHLARALDETTAPQEKRDLIDRAHDTMHEISANWTDDHHTGTLAEIAPFVETCIRIRQQLRAAGQFALADEIRAQLAALGVVLEDNSAGTVWRRNV